MAAHRAAGVEGETLDAIHDHNEIRDAVTEVGRHQVGTDDWFGAVAAVRVLRVHEPEGIHMRIR